MALLTIFHSPFSTLRSRLPGLSLCRLGDGGLRILVLSIIIAGGAFLRFYDLGGPSFWLDEATSFFVAQKDLPGIVQEMIVTDTHPPLHYVLLHYWLWLGDSEFAIRALFAAVGTLSIPVIYLLARTLFGESVGIFSALLLAVSPLHVRYSQEARMYILATFFVLLGTYFQLLFIRRRKVIHAILYVLFMILSLYTFYMTTFALLFQNLFMVYWFLADKSRRPLVKYWLLMQGGILIAFLPWLPVVFIQAGRRKLGWVADVFGPPSASSLLFILNVFSWGFLEQQGLKFVGMFTFGLCLLTAIARVEVSPKSLILAVSWEEPLVFCLMYLFCPLLAAFVVSQFYPMFVIRYLLLFLPPYTMLIAKGIYALRGAALKVAVILLIVTLSFLGIQANYQVQPKANWRGLVQYILEHAQPDDVVAFAPPWWAKPFDYYARGKLAIYPAWATPSSRHRHDRVDSLEELANQHRRVWLVWGSEHYLSRKGKGPIKTYLDEHFSKLRAFHLDGVGEIILYDPDSG